MSFASIHICHSDPAEEPAKVTITHQNGSEFVTIQAGDVDFCLSGPPGIAGWLIQAIKSAQDKIIKNT